MGDDERGDYMYKFVSRDRFDASGTAAARTHNKTLLEHGTLYVAKFTGDGSEDGQYDGTGTWVSPISCPDNVSFDAAGNLWIATDGNGWAPTTASSGCRSPARTAGRWSSSSPCRAARRPAAR